MKFIKNGVIYETNNEFVIGQMQKYGYELIEEKPIIEKPIEVSNEEKPKRKKK